jgi:hypothetical protein
VLPCRIITVFTFRGDRSRAFTDAYDKAMENDRKQGSGGPSTETCLLYAGHTGVSIDRGKTIHGFNPNPPGLLAISAVMDHLAAGGLPRQGNERYADFRWGDQSRAERHRCRYPLSGLELSGL